VSKFVALKSPSDHAARSKPDFSNRQKIKFQVWTKGPAFASDAALARQRVGEVLPFCSVYVSNIALNE
jgi:hypothetical protein